MDTSEKLVADFLAYRGYTNIAYEPDGKVTPDFLVDNRIAIEVRRLNQNFDNGKTFEGLEEAAIPLWHRVKKLVSVFGPATQDVSWFVFYNFRRPIEPWKTLKPKLRTVLEDFVRETDHEKTKWTLGNGFELELYPASNPHTTFFVMGGYSDDESGGWLVHEMERNLRICISEKTKKMTAARSKYAEWWLVLVDYIGYALGDFDREQFRRYVSLTHEWDKIVLVDPYDHTRAFEI